LIVWMQRYEYRSIFSCWPCRAHLFTLYVGSQSNQKKLRLNSHSKVSMVTTFVGLGRPGCGRRLRPTMFSYQTCNSPPFYPPHVQSSGRTKVPPNPKLAGPAPTGMTQQNRLCGGSQLFNALLGRCSLSQVFLDLIVSDNTPIFFALCLS